MKVILFLVLLASQMSVQAIEFDTTNSGEASLVTLSSPTLSAGGNFFKKEALREEAMVHLAQGEILEPSENLRYFLKIVKKDFPGSSYYEILEELIDGSIDIEMINNSLRKKSK